MTRAQARRVLTAKGMRFNHVSPFSDLDREYWWFADGTDVMGDHSATITVFDSAAHISDFSDMRKLDGNS